MEQVRTRKISLLRFLMLCGMIFLFSTSLMVATTPIHEGFHVLMSTLDPCLEVVAFYPFGSPETNLGHVLPSMLGCVIVKEAYPGAFQDRAAWADAFQEVICVLVQILIICFVMIKALPFLLRLTTLSFRVSKHSSVA